MALRGCAATLTDVPEPDRVDCGFVNISQHLCAARGCLFADVPGQTPDGPPACYYAAAGVPITKVHVVFSNHVDVGYTDLVDNAERDLAAGVAPSVVGEYFSWWLEKLERWLDPTETVIGASRNLHAADAAAVRAADGAGIVFRTLETALALFPGAAGPAPFPDVYDVDTSRGVAFPLLANCFWNTNYPSFLPFHAIHGDYAFRFSLEFT